MVYRLLDTQGKPLRQKFSSWLDADHYRHMMGRPDWKIVKTTIKQQNYGESKRYYL